MKLTGKLKIIEKLHKRIERKRKFASPMENRTHKSKIKMRYQSTKIAKKLLRFFLY